MKFLVCLVFFFGTCYCLQRDYPVHREKYGDRITSYKHDIIYRPCAFNDLNCIRRVFAHNSDCKPVKGPIDDPYILDWLPIHLAYANVTFILKNAQVRGLNDWKIKEFYINKVTDKLVLEVVFNALTVYCPAALVRYHRKGKETVELSDYSTVIYKNISLTLTVPNIKEHQLAEADVFAYIPDANPPFSVGSAMTDSSDRYLKAVFKEMLSNIAVSLRAAWVFQGPVIMNAFLEGTVCDFYNDNRSY